MNQNLVPLARPWIGTAEDAHIFIHRSWDLPLSRVGLSTGGPATTNLQEISQEWQWRTDTHKQILDWGKKAAAAAMYLQGPGDYAGQGLNPKEPKAPKCPWKWGPVDQCYWSKQPCGSPGSILPSRAPEQTVVWWLNNVLCAICIMSELDPFDVMIQKGSAWPWQHRFSIPAAPDISRSCPALALLRAMEPQKTYYN